MYLLGIDLGTTSVKAMVFDEKGETKGYAFMECPISYPRAGRAEQDAELIWKITKTVIKKAAGACGDKVGALSLSTQGDAVIAIDKNRKAISPAFLGMDYRGAAQSDFCAKRFGSETLFKRTGMRPHPLNSIIKILWIRSEEPALFHQAYKFVTYADFLLGKLGSDDLVIDYTMAGRTMAFNQEGYEWDKKLLSDMAIPPEKLSTPVPSGRTVGILPANLSAELGLKCGVHLVTGGHDQTCAALGAGITEENTALDSHGTAEVLSTVSNRSFQNRVTFESFYPCYPYIIPDRYFTFALNHAGGALLKWFADNFCREEQEMANSSHLQVYDYIIRQLQDDAPSPLLVLPHFNGSGTPTCDLNSKGAILGLTMTSTRQDMAKAILEALSFELRLNIKTMKQAGISIDNLRAVGGGARSPFVLQNKADILGMPVSTLEVREAACLGAALSAGLATGVYQNVQDAVSVVSIKETYEPHPRLQQLYNEKYYTYCKMYDTLKEILHAL